MNNKFAIENEDYIPFAIEGERHNPKPKTDYKITSDFAKKLSMTGNTERHEQARQYFIACEQGLKIASQRAQSDPNNKTNEKLIELLTSMDNRLSKLEEQSNKKKLPEKKYSRWKTILTKGKIYQIEYAVFYSFLRVIGFEYAGMKLFLYCIATKFAVGCKFCYKRLFRILANLIVREYK